MLPSGSGDQFCSPLVALLWMWFFDVLVYWDFHTGGLFPCPTPFLWDMVSVLSALPAVSVLWWFTVFQFCGAFWLWVLLTGSGDMLCDLRPALLWGVAYRPPALGFPAISAFAYWKFALRLAPCSSPFLWCTFSIPTPSAVVLDYSSLFVIEVFFFWGGSVYPGAVLAYPRGCWENSAWCMVLTCLVCWMSQKQVWSQWWQLRQWWHPSSFLSVTCCGEAFHRLGVKGVEDLILVGAYFCQVWLQCLRQVLESWSLRYLLPYPSHHLGFSEICFLTIQLLVFLTCFGYKHLIRCVVWKYILLFCRLLPQCIDCSFSLP
jgi:hypothetical protein